MYACVVLYLMMSLSQRHNDHDNIVFEAVTNFPGMASDNEPLQQNRFEAKGKRKPRVFGCYFDHSLSSSNPTSGHIPFEKTPQIMTESIINEKRRPTKLPVYWENATYELYPTKRTVDEWSELLQYQEHLENSAYYDKPTHNPLNPYKNYPECIPMHNWQTQSFPTCNSIHEVDLTEFLGTVTRGTALNTDFYRHDEGLKLEYKRLLTHGYFRDTFVIVDQESNNYSPHVASLYPIAFKTLRLRRRYDAWIYDRHRMDALVMERMTTSDNIMDIYGYCGATGLYEFGEKGDMVNVLSMNKRKEKKEVNKMHFFRRLEYAVDVANAIADLHTIEGYNNGMYSAVVHGKITRSKALVSISNITTLMILSSNNFVS